jgi:glycosyltransferase involved in cell wall biosynthesis
VGAAALKALEERYGFNGPLMRMAPRIESFHVQTDMSPGLVWDAQIIANALQQNFVSRKNICGNGDLSVHFQRILLKIKRNLGSTEAVGIFLEDLRPRWLSAFATNILIPNQEWIRPSTKQYLSQCDEIWCKTRYCENAFQKLGCKTRYIGFSSADRYDSQVQKNFNSFIHVQGKSAFKDTATILEAWQKHPHWPTLTVISRNESWLKLNCHNIRVITEFLTDAELGRYMNSAGVHVCPSETEGFGHSINEALSTGALVISTDAPPMNELVRPEFGMLVPFTSSSPAGLGERFQISVDDLSKTVNECLALSHSEKVRRGNLSRHAYLTGKQDFESAVAQAAASLAKQR